MIFLNVNFVSAAVNQTLKDKLLPFVDIKYDYANGIIDEVTIYNRALSPEEINALYSLSPQGIGETWNCTIRAIDSTGAEGINSKTITMPGYALPNITAITITPSPAYDDSELNCSAIYGNPDGNKGNVSISWYNGSALFWQATQYNKINGEQINEPLTWVDKNGLVGYWKFSEGNGTQARDISGNENNGTLANFNFNANSGWGEGKYGKALLFDGSDDYVDAGNVIKNLTNFAFSFWIKIDTFSNPAYMTPFGQSDAIYPSATNAFNFFTGSASDSFGLQGEWTDGSNLDMRVNIPFGVGVWKHIAVTYDGSNVIQYVDGLLLNQKSYSSKSIGNSNSLLFGKGYAQPGSLVTTYFDGTIDEVMIYNRTLSLGEISEIYNNSPHARGETWNCTINATDSGGDAGLPTSKAITISSQSAQNYTPKWVHVTVTYNKITKQKKIYVNGNLTRTETLQGLSDYKINNQAGNLYAGKVYGIPAGNPFNGTIDEILISPKEKSTAEIWQDYLNNIIYAEMPGPNEAKTMAIEGENITEISIAPIVRVHNKEKTCDVTSKVNLPECVQ